MRKYLWIIGILLFSSCLTDVLDLGEEKLDVPKSTKSTYLRFQNLGAYDVSVYSYYTRSPQNKVGKDIMAGTISSQVEWTGNVNTNVQFYLTYQLPLIPDYSIPYDPPVEFAVVEEPVMRYELNTVAIKALVLPGDQPLVNDGAYLIIKNNGVNSFRLMYSSSPVGPEGGKDPLVRSGTAGVYKINPGLTSFYTVSINVTDSPMPAEVGTTFQNGYCYSLVFDGSTVSLAKTGSVAPITLNNINANTW